VRGMFESGIVSERNPSVDGVDAGSDDRRLAAQALGGSYTAYDEIVERNWRRLTSVAGRFVQNPSDVEDIVQEAFVRAFENLQDFRGQSSIQTWLIRITLNLCMNRKRSFWQRKVQLAGFHDETEARGWSNDAPPPDTEVMQKEWSGDVRRVLNGLPDKFRLPILLHYFEELNGREIASVLGWNESTVWSRIYAGCKEMRKSLAAWQD